MNKVTPRAFCRLLAILCVAFFSSHALAGTVVWSGAADGVTFTNAGNWIGNAIPGPSDNAVIGAVSGNPTVIVSGTGLVPVLSLDTSLPLAISSGTLGIGTTLQATQGITFTGATGSIKGGTITTSATAAIEVESFDIGILDGVTLGSNLSILDGATLAVQSGLTLNQAAITLAGNTAGAVLDFDGTQTLSGTGQLVFAGIYSNVINSVGNGTQAGAAILTIGSGITVDGTQGGTIEGYSTGDSFINQGSIIAGTPGSQISLSGSFANEGACSASGGFLQTVGYFWTNTGTLAVSNSGVLNLGGAFTTPTLGAVINTGGTLNLNGSLNNTGSDLALGNTTGSLNFTGGAIVGGTVSSSGSAALIVPAGNYGSAYNVTLAANLTINDGGAFYVQNGLTLSGGAAIAIASNSAATDLYFQGGPQTLGGNGSLVFTGGPYDYVTIQGDGAAPGATILTIGPNVTVDGTANGTFVDSYSFDGLINLGNIIAGAPGQTITIQGNFTNQGACDATGGALDIDAANWTNTTGLLTVSGSGILDIGGTITTGSLGAISNTGGTLNLTGLLVNTGATLTLSDSTGTLNLQSGTIQGGAVTSSGGGALAMPLFGDATLDGVTLQADLTVPPGATLEIVNGITLDATLTVAAGLSGPYNYDSTVLFIGSETVAGNGSIILGGNSGAVDYLTAQGDGTQPGAAILTIGPGITIDALQSAYLDATFPFDAIVNQGAISASASLGDLTIQALFTNQGACSAPAGVLNINGNPWSSTGSLMVSGSGTLAIGGAITTGSLGQITNTGGTLNLTGLLDNTGSTLSLSNTSTGNLNLIGGAISGGSVTSLDGSSLIVPSSCTGVLDAVTLGANTTLENGANLTVQDGLALNDATITIAGSYYQTELDFVGSQTLTGAGELFFGGNNSYANYIYAQGDSTQSGAATLTIGPQITIDGTQGGSIDGYYTFDSIDLEGTVNSDAGGQTITMSGDTVTNDGLIEASNGGSLSLDNLVNSNTLSISGGGSLSLDGSFLNAGIFNDNESTVNFAGSLALSDLGDFTRVGGQVNIAAALDLAGATLALNDSTGEVNLAGGAITSGTITGSSQPFLPGRFGNGLQLGGSVQAFVVPNGLVLSNTAITVEVAFKTTGNGVLFGLQTAPVDQSPGDWNPALYVGADGLLRGQFNIDGVTTPITSASPVNDGNWHLASLVGNSTTQSLYLDGALVGTLAGPIDYQNDSFNQFGDGYTANWPAATGAWFPFAGIIDEARIWSVARTTAQIQATANVALTGTEPGLAAYWSFDQSSGSSVPDLSPNGNTGSLLNQDLLQVVGGGNTLDAVTLATNMTVRNGANLTVQNGLTLDNATVTIAGSYYQTDIFFVGSQTLSGNGELFFGGNNVYANYIYAQGDGSQAGAATLTIGPQITVDGSDGGFIQGYFAYDSILNKGAINADSTTSQPIFVSGSSVTNQGVMEATNGGNLSVTNLIDATAISASGGSILTLLGAWSNTGVISETDSTLDLGGDFTVAALGALIRTGGAVNLTGVLANTGATLALNDTTGPWNLYGGAIIGGTVTGTTQFSTDLLQVMGGGTLNAVTLASNMTVQNGAYLTVQNGLALDGATVTMAGSYSGTFMDFLGSQTLAGLGEIFIGGNNTYANYIYSQGDGSQAGAATLTIGPQITIDGTDGVFIQGYYTYDNILNQGAINADAPGETFYISAASVTNQGAMEATGGGSLTVTNLVDADGLSITGGGTLTLDGDWANTGLLTAVDSTLTLDGSFTNTGTISETDSTVNLGPGYNGTIIETTGGEFFFAQSSTVVHNTDGQATITIQRNFTDPATVEYSTEDGSATAGFEYTASQGTISFQSGQLEQTITIPIIQQDTAPGTSSFTIQLSNPSPGSAVGSPGNTEVVILNDAASDYSLSNPAFTAPSPEPPATSSITVNLYPGTPDEQWRLFGELTWRPSGNTAVGLTPGNFEVEYKPVDGYQQPPLQVVPLVAGSNAVVTGAYTAVALLESGSLQVTMAPAATGGWRLQGGADPTWLPSGQVLANLNTGDYIVEFEPVAGLVTPASSEVLIQANQLATLATTYLVGDSTNGLTPILVPDNIAQSQTPYVFTGQIQTDEGFGSGFVPLDRVVVTAAHVLFDDGTLSYVEGVRWFPQYESGIFEAPPQIPAGSYVLTGYAAQRALDNSPGVASAASRQLDAAALYFLAPADNGARSGYLASDSASNIWLTGPTGKFIAGYPVSGVSPTDRLYATPVLDDPLDYVSGSVFSTDSITSFPGNSGGPLFVQYSDGNYYPAAIYLGGSAETVVHAIDSEVIDLMNSAEVSGNGGANNSGGGIVQVNEGVSGATAYALGGVTVTFTPAAAVTAGAYWELQDDNTVRHSGQSALGLAPGSYMVDFFAAGNAFTAPQPMMVTVSSGSQTQVTAAFIPNPPTITSGSTATAIEGQTFQYQIVASPAVTGYSMSGTLPSGLVFNGATGLISGLVPAGAPTGSSSVILTASNAKGSSSLTLDLIVSIPGALNISITGQGAVPRTFPAHSIQPVGSVLSIKATPAKGYLFGAWTDADTGAVLTTDPTYSFTMPTLLDLQAVFVTNPFVKAAGSYLSLLEGATYADSGYANFTVKPTGAFTATFNLGGQSVKVQNAFNNLGQYEGGFILPGDRVFALTLNLTGTAGENLTGMVTDQANASQIPVNAQLPGPHTNAALAGSYTILLPAVTGTGLPGGNGFATVTVSKTGSVKLIGKLGDGLPVTLAGGLNSDGVFPFLFTKSSGKYNGAELLLGNIAFPPAASGTDGSFEWFRTPNTADPTYPSGFSTILTLLAGSYSKPPVNYSSAQITFSAATLPTPTPITKTLTISSKDKVTYAGPDKFSLTFTTPSGMFMGNFLDTSGIRHTFTGAVLQTGAYGLGQFQSASGATGSVTLQPSP